MWQFVEYAVIPITPSLRGGTTQHQMAVQPFCHATLAMTRVLNELLQIQKMIQ